METGIIVLIKSDVSLERRFQILFSMPGIGVITAMTLIAGMPEKDVVWSTKYRFKVLRVDIQLRIREIIRRVCVENGVDIINGVVSSDHVHLFISMPRKFP